MLQAALGGVNSQTVLGHNLGAVASGTDTSWGGQMWKGACPMQQREKRQGAEVPKLG